MSLRGLCEVLGRAKGRQGDYVCTQEGLAEMLPLAPFLLQLCRFSPPPRQWVF